ncbi:MAG: hypothetical protein ACREYC_13050 [Gammaproteobacteria bacterium]
MKQTTNQADRLAELTDVQRVEMVIELITEFGETLERKFPEEAAYLPRAFIGAALTRISAEHGSEIAIRVLREIVDELESGSPGDDTVVAVNEEGDPGSQMH